MVLGPEWDRIKLLIPNTFQHKSEMQTVTGLEKAVFFLQAAKKERKKDPAVVQVEPVGWHDLSRGWCLKHIKMQTAALVCECEICCSQAVVLQIIQKSQS